MRGKCSFANKTYKDFQLILVDDGSPDNSGTICDEYAKKDDRVMVIHQENGGLSVARNTGIDWIFAHSESEWITFIDSDDWVHPKYLESLINAAIRINANIVVSDHIRTSKECEYHYSITSPEIVSAEQFYCDNQITATVAWGKLYQRWMFKSLRYPVGKINEDEYVTFKMLFEADSIAYIQTPLYYYYENAEGIMGRSWSLKSLDAIGGYEEQLKYFRKEKYKKAYHSASDRYIGVLRYHLHQLKLVHPDERKRIYELEFKLKWMTMKKYIQKKKQTLSFLLKKK